MCSIAWLICPLIVRCSVLTNLFCWFMLCLKIKKYYSNIMGATWTSKQHPLEQHCNCSLIALYILYFSRTPFCWFLLCLKISTHDGSLIGTIGYLFVVNRQSKYNTLWRCCLIYILHSFRISLTLSCYIILLQPAVLCLSCNELYWITYINMLFNININTGPLSATTILYTLFE